MSGSTSTLNRARLQVKLPHECGGVFPGWDGDFSQAVWYCCEDSQGRFVAGNEEYDSMVNFCPYCGEKAPVQVEIKSMADHGLKSLSPLNEDMTGPGTTLLGPFEGFYPLSEVVEGQ